MNGLNRDDIFRMAQEAGAFVLCDFIEAGEMDIERFAELVAAAEREACIKAIKDVDDYQSPAYPECIQAIQARGQE